MKMRIIYSSLFCLLAPAGIAIAQDSSKNTPPPPPSPMQCPQHMGSGMQKQFFHNQMRKPYMAHCRQNGYMLKKLQEDLKLTDKQVQAMKDLRMKASAERREAIKTALESIKAKEDAELKTILTEEQYKAFTERRGKMRKHMKQFKKGYKGPGNCFVPMDCPWAEDED